MYIYHLTVHQFPNYDLFLGWYNRECLVYVYLCVHVHMFIEAVAGSSCFSVFISLVIPFFPGLSLNDVLQQASTDKLRVLSELLLDTLLGMTYPRPTIPQVPAVLYTMFTPQTCESLFRNLCVAGTKKMQINAGVLLVRLCSCQPWWGEFLSGTLQQYFSSEQPLIFPRDRCQEILSLLYYMCLGVFKKCSH